MYQVDPFELSEHCDGAEHGFVESVEVEIGSALYIGLPIVTVLGKAR